jgi:hypothetical protein
MKLENMIYCNNYLNLMVGLCQARQSSRIPELWGSTRTLKQQKININYTVTKSEPNEASLWKITLQKRENSHVNAGTFIPPLTRFLYILLCGNCL